VLTGSGAGGAETWDEDGLAWSLRATEPRVDREGASAYDAARERIVFVGGNTSTGLAVADVWQFASLAPALFDAFGAGCPGSLGVPALTSDGLPWLGDTLTLRVDAVPATATAVVDLGFSNTSYGGTALPFDLAALGYPGCQIVAAPEFVLFAGGGPQAVRTLPLSLPNIAAFAGTELFLQAVFLDGATQSIFTSGGRRARLGIR
jgi:hypothetical protein